MNPTDSQLLKQFANHRDESAFEILSQRYLGLILNTARRRANNNALAEDTAQRVLCILVKKAGTLSQREDSLGPWIHRTTLYEASKVMRSESSHQKKKTELELERRTQEDEPTESQYLDVLPHLDQALDKLQEVDRKILLLHYFEGLTFEQIAPKIGKSLAATQKRSQRALQKMSDFLRRKGVTLSIVSLTSLLGSELSQGSTPALVKTLTAQSLSAAQVGLSTFHFSPALLFALASTVVAIPIVYQEMGIAQTRELVVEASPRTSSRASTTPSARRIGSHQPEATDFASLDPFALAKAYHVATKENSPERSKIESYLGALPFEELLELLLVCTSPELPPRYHDSFVYFLVGECSEKNPKLTCQTLVDLSLETPPRDFRRYIAQQIEKWTSQNPDEAMQWIREQLAAHTLGELTKDVGPLAIQVLESHFTQLIKTSPDQVFQFLAEIPEGVRGGIIGSAFSRSYGDHSDDKVSYGLALAEHLLPKDRPYLIGPLAIHAFSGAETAVSGLKGLLANPDLREGDRKKVFEAGVGVFVFSLPNAGKFNFPSEQRLQEFEDWIFSETADASYYIVLALASNGTRPGDPILQHWTKDHPSVIAGYLQHKDSETYLTETDESLQEAFRLAENITVPEERERTINHLNLLKEKHDDN